MKIFILMGLVSLLATPLASADASASGEFWAQVQTLISRCAVRTYEMNDGQKVYGALHPSCNDIRLDSRTGPAAGATFTLAGEWYTATISDAADSDDGDLDNVDVYDSKGVLVAQRTEVLAFGDILQALSGDQAQVPEVLVP